MASKTNEAERKIRRTETVIPKSIRRAERQTEQALKCLSRGYAEEVWDDVDELEEMDTRGHVNHKQTLR